MDYLTVKADARFTVHPRLFEEVVGAAFRNIGYDVLVTSYSNDGGLDAILTIQQG
jgi:restriction system protein